MGEIKTVENLIAQLDEDIQRLEPKRKTFEKNIDIAKEKICDFLDLNWAQKSILNRVIGSYLSSLFSTPLTQLKNLSKALQATKKSKAIASISAEDVTKIYTHANIYSNIAELSTTLNASSLNALDDKDKTKFKNIAKTRIGKNYPAGTNAQVGLIFDDNPPPFFDHLMALINYLQDSKELKKEIEDFAEVIEKIGDRKSKDPIHFNPAIPELEHLNTLLYHLSVFIAQMPTDIENLKKTINDSGSKSANDSAPTPEAPPTSNPSPSPETDKPNTATKPTPKEEKTQPHQETGDDYMPKQKESTKMTTTTATTTTTTTKASEHNDTQSAGEQSSPTGLEYGSLTEKDYRELLTKTTKQNDELSRLKWEYDPLTTQIYGKIQPLEHTFKDHQEHQRSCLEKLKEINDLSGESLDRKSLFCHVLFLNSTFEWLAAKLYHLKAQKLSENIAPSELKQLETLLATVTEAANNYRPYVNISELSITNSYFTGNTHLTDLDNKLKEAYEKLKKVQKEFEKYLKNNPTTPNKAQGQVTYLTDLTERVKNTKTRAEELEKQLAEIKSTLSTAFETFQKKSHLLPPEAKNQMEQIYNEYVDAISEQITKAKGIYDGNNPDLAVLEKQLDEIKNFIDTSEKDRTALLDRLELENTTILPLMEKLNKIVDNPKNAYNLTDETIANLSNGFHDYGDVQQNIQNKLKEMQEYSKLLVGSDFERGMLEDLKQVQPIELPDSDLFKIVQSKFNEAISRLNDAVTNEKTRRETGLRRIHDEGYKSERSGKERAKQKAAEKDLRLSIINNWIAKYEVRLGNYTVKGKDDKTKFIPSFTAEWPPQAAKLELCNALTDVRIKLEGLYSKEKAKIESAWRDLNNINQINKKLNELEKAKIINGRTERMIYHLYAILHCCHVALYKSANADLKPFINALQKLSNTFSGASGLAMRLSGATIYKAKTHFQGLIKFLMGFIQYKDYYPKGQEKKWERKTVLEVRKQIMEELKQQSSKKSED